MIGSLENNFDSKSDRTSLSRDQESYIESSVFKVAEDNQSEIRKYLIEEKRIISIEKGNPANSPPNLN